MLKDKMTLFSRTRPGTVIDENLAKKLGSKTKKDGLVIVDRNAWFAVSMILGIIALVAMFMAVQANNRFAENVQVAWVKMYPNGTWDIDFYDESRGQEFFQSTIDALIREWVERRYSEVQHSIRFDYGYVQQFMSAKLAREFVDINGFNAARKAAEVMECMTCDETFASVRNIDHYDSDKTNFGRVEGTLYRSNVFIREETKDSEGGEKGTNNKIVSLQWRLKSKKEIEANRDQLKINPIGLEIIRSDLLADPSAQHTLK